MSTKRATTTEREGWLGLAAIGLALTLIGWGWLATRDTSAVAEPSSGVELAPSFGPSEASGPRRDLPSLPELVPIDDSPLPPRRASSTSARRRPRPDVVTRASRR